MKLPKKKYIFLGGGLAVLALVLLLIAAALPKPLQSQKQAERWAGESGERFVQFSRFFPPTDSSLQRDSIAALRQTLTEKLTAASMETPPGGKLFCDAWSTAGTLKVKSERGSFETAALAVGGSYFDFHPLTLCSGGFLSEGDLMKDRVVLDAQLAWLLYGSTDLAGLTVEIDGQQFFIAGVVERESGRAVETVAEPGPMLYLPYETWTAMHEGAGADCYEIVLPEPAEGFAKAVLEECLPTDSGVLRENTGRFRFGASLKLLKEWNKGRLRTEAVAFPDWENAALYTESRCALLRVLALIALLFPAVLVCIELVRLALFAREKLRGGGRAIYEKALEKSDARRERRMRLRSGSSHLKGKG